MVYVSISLSLLEYPYHLTWTLLKSTKANSHDILVNLSLISSTRRTPWYSLTALKIDSSDERWSRFCNRSMLLAICEMSDAPSLIAIDSVSLDRFCALVAAEYDEWWMILCMMDIYKPSCTILLHSTHVRLDSSLNLPHYHPMSTHVISPTHIMNPTYSDTTPFWFTCSRSIFLTIINTDTVMTHIKVWIMLLDKLYGMPNACKSNKGKLSWFTYNETSICHSHHYPLSYQCHDL